MSKTTKPAKGKPKAAGSKEPKQDSRDPHGIFAAEFDRLDRNGDASVDWKEFHHGLISAGWDANALSDLFETIDVSRDGKISREEYLNYHARKNSQPMLLDPKAVFTEFDADKDEHLNLRELAKLIRKIDNDEGFLGDTDFSNYVKEQLAAADKDKDSKLNLAEFLDWYKGFVHHIEDIRERFEDEQRKKKEAKQTSVSGSPANPSQFTGDGVWEVQLKDLMVALEAAWAKKKTPILIDDSADDRESPDATPLELFLQYGNYTLLEMKKMVVEVNIQKVKKLEEAMEEARKKLVIALKHGNTLCVLLANSVPPIKSKFSSDKSLPLAIFDGNMVDAVAGSASLESTWVENVIRKEDDVLVVRDQFRVMVVTKFAREDYHGFLKDDVPLDLMQHIYVHNKKPA